MPIQRLFGLVFDSDILLPGLIVSGVNADVRIDSRTVASGCDYAAFETRLDEQKRIDIQHDHIRYLVSEGRKVEIEMPADADPLLVRGWLTGTVMAAVLVQRGLLPIHANAFRHGNSAIAFVGDSGAGKSTLAMQIVEHGMDLLCDDLMAVRLDQSGATVLRGIPRIKLWRETALHFGHDPATLDPVIADFDKFQMPVVTTAQAGDEFPLRRLYVLEAGAPDEEPTISRVSGAEAGALVIDNAYRWQIASLWHGSDDWAFTRCLELARHVELYRFRRPWSLERLDESLATLLDHLA